MVADFETLLDYVGGFGVWQQRLLVFMSLNLLFQGFQNLGSVFLAATPDHWCHVPGLAENLNWTDQVKDFILPKEVRHGKKGYTKCYYYDRNYADLFNYSTDLSSYSLNDDNVTVPILPCTDWIYDKELYSSTIVTEWNLVCSSRWLMSSVQAGYMAGVLVGCLIFGFASDRWGRRNAMIIAQIIFCFASIATAFAPHYVAFIIGRFLIAVAAPGVSGCGFCLITEIVATKWRAVAGLCYQIPFGIGYAVLPGLAYLFRDWPSLQLAISVPSLILLLSLWLVPESPRWLVTKERYKEAIKILQKCAKANGNSLPTDDELQGIMKSFKIKQDENQRKPSCANLKLVTKLCDTRDIFKLTLTAYFTWFVVALVYYGLALNSPTLGGDPYIVVFLGGILEVPAYIIGFLVVNKIGRRITYSVTFLIAAALCFFIVVIPSDITWLTSTLAIMGKFIISMTFGIAYVYTAELFPTTIRNIAVSYGSVCGRVGSISAPYVVYLLATYHSNIPLILFGLLSTLAGLVSLLLPETKQQHLTETVGEILGENRCVRKPSSVF